MLFNSYIFIFLFLPVSLVAFYAIAKWSHRAASAWLVVVSFAFYGWWNPPFVMLLAGSIAFNYCIGIALQSLMHRPLAQRLTLTGGIAANLTLLFYYKYFVAAVTALAGMGLDFGTRPDDILLPLGISFFTFTQIGYLLDCNSGIAKGRKLIDYALFVTFFPHLIAGPILHHREMMPQFENKETYRFKAENLAVGLTIFIIGLAKKVMIADQMAPIANNGFSYPADLSPIAAWGGALGYSLQLYFDFSGYSDMAIGLARMFGVRFPANFNSPYKASSIIDFWQRWHMTLTRYLTLYLYNPVAMGITRRRLAAGLPVARQGVATPSGFLTMVAVPTLYTMLLAGVWHGAGLQFLVFGLLHGVYLTINHGWRTFGPKTASTWASTAGYVILTYLAVLVAQVFFRAESASAALALLASMTGLAGLFDFSALQVTEVAEIHFGLLPSQEQLVATTTWIKILGCFLIVFAAPNSLEIMAKYEPILGKFKPSVSAALQWQPNVKWGVLTGALGAASFLYLSGATEFLYFQF